MSSVRAGVLSGGIGFASRAVVQLLLFGVTIVATRKLSIEAFGAFALASLFVILARQLFYVGPYEYLLKSSEEDDFGACLFANLALALFSGVLLTMFYLVAPAIFGTANIATLLALLTPSIFLVALTSWYEAVLLRASRVRRYYLTTLLGDVLGATVAVWLLLQGFGVVSLVVQTYTRLGVLLALYAADAGWPKVTWRWHRVGQVIAWSRARYVAVLLNFTSAYGADFVLGAMLTPVATGLYRASNRVVSTVTDLFAHPLQKIAQSNISADYVRGRQGGTAWLSMLAGVGAIAWSALATLAFLADDLIPLALGAKWAPAVPVVIAFCVIRAFAVLDAVTTSFLVCHDQQRAMLRVQIASAAGVVLLSLAASPFGTVAVAVAAGLATTAMSLTYGAMVMRLSAAGAGALLNLLATSGRPVAGVALGLLTVEFAAPELNGVEAIAVGLIAAAAGFLLTGFGVRHRILSAIATLEPVTQGRQS